MGVKDNNTNKNHRKSFFYYYGIVLLVVFLLNTFLVPQMMERSVREVSYDQSLYFFYHRCTATSTGTSSGSEDYCVNTVVLKLL